MSPGDLHLLLSSGKIAKGSRTKPGAAAEPVPDDVQPPSEEVDPASLERFSQGIDKDSLDFIRSSTQRARQARKK